MAYPEDGEYEEGEECYLHDGGSPQGAGHTSRGRRTPRRPTGINRKRLRNWVLWAATTGR